MVDQNREIIDWSADRYLERHLTPLECLLLSSLKSRWCIDMQRHGRLTPGTARRGRARLRGRRHAPRPRGRASSQNA